MVGITQKRPGGCARRIGSIVVLSGVLLFAGESFAPSSSASPSGSAVAPVTSLAQLEGVLAKSIKQETLPVDLVPSLTALANVNNVQGSTYLHPSCDPYVVNSEAQDPLPCWYGSTSSHRTVVIFGDSFVGNWIPALDLAGQALDFRVAEFSFPGCNTPFVNPAGPSQGFDESEVTACVDFHENLPASVNELNPIAVIAADGSLSWGSAGNPSFIAGLNTAFNEMATSTNHPVRILLGTGPHLNEAAPSCLATHPSSIARCNFTYAATSVFAATLARDDASVQGARVNLIPTYQWVCFKDVCPVVIGHVEVYADEDHFTIAISKYLSVLLEKALAPLLGSAT